MRIRRAHTVAALAVACGLLAAEAAASACSLCGCGDPLVDVSDSVPGTTFLRLALDLEMMSATAANDDAPGAEESVTRYLLRPVIVYSPLKRLNLVAQLPFGGKDWKLDGGGKEESATPIGLGDIDLGARWFVLSSRDWEALSRSSLGVSAGLSLPTGPDDAGSDGMRLDDHAQLGTGSFGPYLGLAYAYHRDPWNLYATVTGRTHTTNSHHYRYGSSIRWSAREDYRPFERLAFEVGLDGRYAAKDSASGEPVENTGGLVLAAAPGLAFRAASGFWLRARAELPFFTHLWGEQSVGPTLFASAQYIFR